MKLNVKLFATFRKGRFSEKDIELPNPGTVADVLGQLDIPAEQVGILLVNGRNVSVDTELADDDIISIFPAIGGG